MIRVEQGSLDDPERPLKRICQAAIYYLLQNKLEKYTRTRTDEEAIHSCDYLPTELLFKIMRQLDTSTMCECRMVCSRWQQIADKLLLETEKLPTFKLSRLIITGLSHDALEFRRVNYDEQRSKDVGDDSRFCLTKKFYIFFEKPQQSAKDCMHPLPYGASANLNLTNLVIDFLCIQLSMCDLSSMTHLSLQVVDFWYANTYTLHRLLTPIAKYIEVLELCESTGMQEDSVTDAHLAQLNASKVRSVMIDRAFDNSQNKVDNAPRINFLRRCFQHRVALKFVKRRHLRETCGQLEYSQQVRGIEMELLRAALRIKQNEMFARMKKCATNEHFCALYLEDRL
ncbi:unnamed protein product [Angiostrongylus costaricensis]|uniref:F-box domain-containing protein n=1 Tax=Angiostrongylus costaricensis TaxID=334426 RepID=A0A158PH50_ANGCS|nr:unnamed protein product [Angiostrongylus costaricensis]